MQPFLPLKTVLKEKQLAINSWIVALVRDRFSSMKSVQQSVIVKCDTNESSINFELKIDQFVKNIASEKFIQQKVLDKTLSAISGRSSK
ncbi:MAG: hypothetical protein KME16_08435 [Scytolyngbya sp. HA4215-MV1]|jgi:hypothetical protein|nr:hypothetical protein [Scytolyngbya sp. HA4215-MV1]